VAESLDLLSAYWPYMAGVFMIGVIVGWWGESRAGGRVQRGPTKT